VKQKPDRNYESRKTEVERRRFQLERLKVVETLAQ